MKARRSWTDATIPSKTLNYHRWRNQSIHEKTKFTEYLSMNSALQMIIMGKLQHKEGKRCPRKQES
nr:protein,transforming [Gallus gallus]